MDENENVDLIYNEEYDVTLSNHWDKNKMIAVFFDPPERYKADKVTWSDKNYKGWSNERRDLIGEAFDLFSVERSNEYKSYFLELHPLSVLRLISIGV